MKNPFRLMTIFMAIIGGCAASLVIYILTIYPNLNRDVKDKNVEISSSYTNTAQENITIDDNKPKIHLPPNIARSLLHLLKRNQTLNLLNQALTILMI